MTAHRARAGAVLSLPRCRKRRRFYTADAALPASETPTRHDRVGFLLTCGKPRGHRGAHAAFLVVVEGTWS